MELRRRTFLKGVIAAAVVARVPLPTLPVIRGDGLHDDAPGLQALLDGEPVSIEAEGIIAASGRIEGGVFRLGRTVVLPRKRRFLIKEATFWADADVPAVFFARPGDEDGFGAIEYCHFNSDTFRQAEVT